MSRRYGLRSSTALAGPIGALLLLAPAANAEELSSPSPQPWSSYFAAASSGRAQAGPFDASAYAGSAHSPAVDGGLLAYDMAPAGLPPRAVDGFNGKVDGFGGTKRRTKAFGAARAPFRCLSAPLYGLQVDGAGGALDNRGFGAVAAHGFWRDPSRGLIGIYGAYYNLDAIAGGTSSRPSRR